MSPRRLALTCLITLATTACANPQRSADPNPTADQPLVERTLPYPTDTRAVARIQLDAVPDLVDRALQLRRAARGEATDEEPSDPPGVSLPDRAASLLAWSLFEGRVERGDLHRTLIDRDEVPEKLRDRMLTEVDTSRPVVAALSTRHNEQLLRQLRYGAPGTDLAAMPRGFSLRIFFPAEGEPTKLVSQIDAACGGPCRKVVRTATHESWAVVDVHYDPLGRYRQKQVPETIPDSWEASEEYFERMTPAARAFLTAETAFAAYGRTEDLADVGALAGALETFFALQNASPHNRRALATRGFSLAGRLYEFEDPNSRENEDYALRFGTTDEGGWTLDTVATRTERGRAIDQKMTFDGRLPAIEHEGAALHLDYALDPDAAVGEAAIPEIFRRAIDGDNFTSLLGALRNGGPWAYYHLLLSYPNGLLKAVDASWQDLWGPRLGMPRPPWRQIYAVRAALGVRSSQVSQYGLAPTGGIAALVDSSSPIPTLADRFAGMAGGLIGVRIRVETEAREETGRTLVTATFGDAGDELFGDPTPIDVGLSGRLHADRLSPLADKLPRGRRGGPPARRLWRMARALGTAHLDAIRANGATAYRLQTGNEAPDEFAIPESRAEPATPTARPDCARRAAEASRRTLGTLTDPDGDSATLDDDGPHARIEDLLTRLESAEKRCRDRDEPAADTLRWVRGRWLQRRATTEAESGHFATATETMRRGCELVGNAECPDAETLQSYADDYRAPTGTAHLRLASPPRGLFFLGRTSPFYPDTGDAARSRDLDDLRINDLTGDESDGRAAAQKTLTDKLPVEVLELPDGTRASAAVVAIDRDHDADLLEAATRAADGKSPGRRAYEQTTYSRLSHPPKNVTLLAIHVRPDDETDPSTLPVVLLRTAGASVSSEAPPINLTVTPDGLTLEETDTADPVPLDALPDALPELDENTPPPVFILKTPEPVSTARLTDLASTLTAYARSTHGDNAIPHLRFAAPD